MSSPAQEFYDLAHLYLKRFGTEAWALDTRIAFLDRLRILCRGNTLLVEYIQPCSAYYETVWSPTSGFAVDNWQTHLDALRRALILERLADV